MTLHVAPDASPEVIEALTAAARLAKGQAKRVGSGPLVVLGSSSVEAKTLCPHCNKESRVPLDFNRAGWFSAFHACPWCAKRIDLWLHIQVRADAASTNERQPQHNDKGEPRSPSADAAPSVPHIHAHP